MVKTIKKKHPARPQGKSKVWLYINVMIALALIAGGIVMLFWMGERESSKPVAQSAQMGRMAPDFELTSLTGEPVALSDYQGQVVLINTWATWCPPCKAEMPAIDDFYQAHQADGLVVLAVNSQEDAATVQRFIEAQGFSFPILLDTQARVMEQYQVRGLPTTFVIDRSGMIRYVHTGAITAQQLEQVVGPLL